MRTKLGNRALNVSPDVTPRRKSTLPQTRNTIRQPRVATWQKRISVFRSISNVVWMSGPPSTVSAMSSDRQPLPIPEGGLAVDAVVGPVDGVHLVGVGVPVAVGPRAGRRDPRAVALRRFGLP